MGYDTVYVECLGCGGIIEIQTKDGPCKLENFNLRSVPPAVATELNGMTGICLGCGWTFIVKTQFIITVHPTRGNLL